jgi:hypothetical protein
MRIGLISDEILFLNLQADYKIEYITLENYKTKINKNTIDFLLIESAWNGLNNAWKYKLAKYPVFFWRTNNDILKVINFAKDKNIKVVFWSKEDGVHFNRFINIAKHCNYIFTVDENSIDCYRQIVDKHIPIHSLMFAINPNIHYFSGFNNKIKKACFAGSYSIHLHPNRRRWQKMAFAAASKADLGPVIFDRNFRKKRLRNKYPRVPNIIINEEIPYLQTAEIYKKYLINLNVNTIVNSPTMFSRRLIEILACGGLCVTNSSLAVKILFNDYVYIADSNHEIIDIFRSIKSGLAKKHLEKAKAGAEYVLKNHCWEKRINKIIQILN